MIDPDVIANRLAKIRENEQLLKKLQDVPFDDFVSDRIKHLAAEHALQVSIQAVVDICSYLVASLQAAMPSAYRELPQALSKEGIFPKEFADRLADMIGLRNVLVHEYMEVDLRTVHEMVRERLSDFDDFARCIVSYLEREGLA